MALLPDPSTCLTESRHTNALGCNVGSYNSLPFPSTPRTLTMGGHWTRISLCPSHHTHAKHCQLQHHVPSHSICDVRIAHTHTHKHNPWIYSYPDVHTLDTHAMPSRTRRADQALHTSISMHVCTQMQMIAVQGFCQQPYAGAGHSLRCDRSIHQTQTSLVMAELHCSMPQPDTSVKTLDLPSSRRSAQRCWKQTSGPVPRSS